MINQAYLISVLAVAAVFPIATHLCLAHSLKLLALARVVDLKFFDEVVLDGIIVEVLCLLVRLVLACVLVVQCFLSAFF